MNEAGLCVSLVVSSIGAGIGVYGMRQKKGLPLLVGGAMGIYPYFVENALVMGLVGAALLALLWLGPRYGLDF